MIPVSNRKFLACLIAAFFLAVVFFRVSRAEEKINYVALGDSYTIGTGASLAASWPVVLTLKLEEDGIPLAMVANLAQAGWTSKDVIDHQLPRLKELSPDFVTLLIGANDWVQGVTAETFQQWFSDLLDGILKTVPNKNLLVLTIPDFSVTPKGSQYGSGRNIVLGIEEFNAIILKEARQRKVSTFDLYAVSKGMADDPALVSPDGLHPSAQCYTQWAVSIFPVAKEILKNK